MSRRDQPGCLPTVFRWLSRLLQSPADDTGLPYRRRDYLLSKAERSFFGVLLDAAAADYLVFAKVRLADLVWIPAGTETRQAYFNRIQGKHVDFLLCDRATVRPLLAIELDDASHQRASRRLRDEFVDDALRAADLPLLRVPARGAYNVHELAQQIRERINPHTP